MVETPTDSTRNSQFRGLFLVCQNLQQSTLFYQSLGFRPTKSSRRSQAMEHNGTEIHLHENLTPTEESAYHVQWERGGKGIVLLFNCPDLQGLWERAPASSRLVAPKTTPWGDSIAMLCDPDGYRLEFRQEET